MPGKVKKVIETSLTPLQIEIRDYLKGFRPTLFKELVNAGRLQQYLEDKETFILESEVELEEQLEARGYTPEQANYTAREIVRAEFLYVNPEPTEEDEPIED